MISVACGGTAERIAARIFFRVLRASSGITARYSFTVFGALFGFAAELRLPAFAFIMRGMLRELPPPSPRFEPCSKPCFQSAPTGGERIPGKWALLPITTPAETRQWLSRSCQQ